MRKVHYRERDDARQEVWMAIIKAQRRFDPSNGAAFTTFIDQRAHGAVVDFLRKQNPLSRAGYQRVVAGEEEKPVHLPIGDPEVLRLLHSQATQERAVLVREVAECVARISSRQCRHVLFGYLRDDTSAEIARELKVTDGWVSQQRKNGIKRLRAEMSV